MPDSPRCNSQRCLLRPGHLAGLGKYSRYSSRSCRERPFTRGSRANGALSPMATPRHCMGNLHCCRCGTPVRLGAAYRAISDTTEKRTVISELESGTLRGLVEVYQYEFVRPRHRVIGEQMLQHCMTLDEIFNISRQLTLALAPYVNRQNNNGSHARNATRAFADGFRRLFSSCIEGSSPRMVRTA